MKYHLVLGQIVSDQWQSYLQACWPAANDQPTPEQINEFRKTFFAGVTMMLGIMQAIGHDPSIDEEAASAVLDSIEKELIAFAQNLPPANPVKPFVWTPSKH